MAKFTRQVTRAVIPIIPRCIHRCSFPRATLIHHVIPAFTVATHREDPSAVPVPRVSPETDRFAAKSSPAPTSPVFTMCAATISATVTSKSKMIDCNIYNIHEQLLATVNYIKYWMLICVRTKFMYLKKKYYNCVCDLCL